MKILALGILLFSTSGNAAPLLFSSGEQRVHMLELFTSEGCSSCPPAERWMNSLREDAALWQTFVPVAFHVDYWDYIGWKDSFAQARFNTRQHQYAAQGGAQVVYTPGMFRDGAEWLGWRSGESIANTQPRARELSLTVDGDAVHARYQSANDEQLLLHVALLGMGLETKVRAGENKGRTLKHDFVALALTSKSLSAGDGEHVTALPIPTSHIKATRHALVAWVSRTDSQAPLQATGGFID